MIANLRHPGDRAQARKINEKGNKGASDMAGGHRFERNRLALRKGELAGLEFKRGFRGKATTATGSVIVESNLKFS
jgi:hypothetical protein